jgi:orotate phosphoribosyltransferase
LVERDEILALFKKYGALLEGHFLLSSGLHSPRYLQCALVLQHPEIAEKLGRWLSSLFDDLNPDGVISPALGGIVIGQEVGRALKKRAIFVERVMGKMTLRRGFTIKKGERFLVVEDVITTGGSSREVVNTVREHGGEVVGVGAIINRGTKEIEPGLEIRSLAKVEIPTYPPARCPLCNEGKIPLIKPGSKTIIRTKK